MKVSEFSQLLKDRYSVRDFRPDPIAPETLAAILEDARHVASWSNTRPYVLAIASGAQTDRLRAAYTKAYAATEGLRHRKPLAVVKALMQRKLPDGDFKTWGKYPADLNPRRVKIGSQLYGLLGIARGDRAARDQQDRRNLEFFGAPTVAFLFVHDGLLPFSAHDGGLMLQTLMLSAQAHGIGSCALGTLATWRHPIDAEFQIPAHYKLITGLALGYPTEAKINTFRAEHPPIVLAAAKN